MKKNFNVRNIDYLLNEEINFDKDILNLYYRIINLKNDKKESELTYIYFIREYKIFRELENGLKYTKNIKIGHAKNPLQRLSEMQTGNSNLLHIDVCIKSTVEAEKIIHNFFCENNIRGEWFFESPFLKEFTDIIYIKDCDYSYQKLKR